MTTPSLDHELQKLSRALARSRAAIADGVFVNLSGLDVEVARLAQRARGAPSDARADLLTALSVLLRELDGLAVDLQRQHDSALAQHAADVYSRD